MDYQLISEYNYNPFEKDFFRNIIFQNRNTEITREFLAPDTDNLHDWTLLDNIEKGCELLRKHQHNKIFMIVDSDVDGYTSAAIFHNFVKIAFKDIEIGWMVHEGKEHGIILDKIPKETDLLVVIDGTSNQYKEYEVLAENGIDILIIDHHEAPHYSEHAVIINNYLSKDYPNNGLSGAGMAYKFCCALAADLGDTSLAGEFLDLAALGLIADMMDVRELENRFIIHHGLRNIKNPFFQALIKVQSYSLGSQPLNTIGVMFYIAPLINSVVRVGTMEEKHLMFRAFIEGNEQIASGKRGSKGQLATIATEAARVAGNARARQKRIVDELQAEIEPQIDLTKPVLLIKVDGDKNRNILGLVANQLAHKYKKPTLILADSKEGLRGSGRNYGLSEIENFKDILNDTNLFDFAEGHQSAFGAKIQEENVDKFFEYWDEHIPEAQDEDVYLVDFIFSADQINPYAVKQIAALRPLWGKGFDEPYIAVENIKLLPTDITVMGKMKNHVKFRANDIDYVIFYADLNDFVSKSGVLSINLIGRSEINIWLDKVSAQVIVKDYKITEQESAFGF